MNTNVSPKLQEWLVWIEEIKNFTHTLMSNHAIYKRYVEIVKDNPSVQNPSDFHQWVFVNYGQSVASKIRAQLDPNGITIRRLLKDIQKHPGTITRAWYTSLYEPMQLNDFMMSVNFGDSDFDEIAGTGDSFDVSIAAKDEEHLCTIGEDIKNYVDKRIAHYIIQDKKVKDIKFNDMDKFIKEYEEVIIRYIQLLTGSGYVSMTPTWQYDWDKIFTHKWIDVKEESY